MIEARIDIPRNIPLRRWASFAAETMKARYPALLLPIGGRMWQTSQLVSIDRRQRIITYQVETLRGYEDK